MVQALWSSSESLQVCRRGHRVASAMFWGLISLIPSNATDGFSVVKVVKLFTPCRRLSLLSHHHYSNHQPVLPIVIRPPAVLVDWPAS